MRGSTRKRVGTRIAVGAASALTALVTAAAPASASAMSVTEHQSWDPTGSSFTCGSSALLITTGTVDEIFHVNQDNKGVYHFTDTITPHDITLVDANGATYTLSGAGWWGGKTLDPESDNAILESETDHFVIHDATGGVYGKVQINGHLSPNGKFVFNDFGSCETPQD